MKKKNVRTMAATAMVGVMTASVGITACAAPQMNQMQGGKGQVGIEAGMQDSEMPQEMSQMPGGQKNDNQQAPDVQMPGGQNNTDQQAPDVQMPNGQNNTDRQAPNVQMPDEQNNTDWQAPNGQMPDGQNNTDQQAPNGQMQNGQNNTDWQAPNRQMPNGQNNTNQQTPNGQMPNCQKPEGEAPDGINIEGVREAISRLEDESAKTSVQTYLDEFIKALDAEREALDSGSCDETTLSTLKDAVDEARETLSNALNTAGIDVASIKLPEMTDEQTKGNEMVPPELMQGEYDMNGELPELPDGEATNDEMSPDQERDGQMPSFNTDNGRNSKDAQGALDGAQGQQENHTGEPDGNFMKQLLDKLINFFQNMFNK